MNDRIFKSFLWTFYRINPLKTFLFAFHIEFKVPEELHMTTGCHGLAPNDFLSGSRRPPVWWTAATIRSDRHAEELQLLGRCYPQMDPPRFCLYRRCSCGSSGPVLSLVTAVHCSGNSLKCWVSVCPSPAGPEGHRPPEDGEAGRGLLLSSGGHHPGTHRRQLPPSPDHTVQRDAPAWVHTAPARRRLPRGDRVLNADRVLHSRAGHQAVRGRREEGSSQRRVSLSPLHGVCARGGVQEDAAGAPLVMNDGSVMRITRGWLCLLATGRNGLVQNRPQESLLLLVRHESGDAGRSSPSCFAERLFQKKLNIVACCRRQSPHKMISWPRPCSCRWPSGWWRRWSERTRLKQKQRWGCRLHRVWLKTWMYFPTGPFLFHQCWWVWALTPSTPELQLHCWRSLSYRYSSAVHAVDRNPADSEAEISRFTQLT